MINFNDQDTIKIKKPDPEVPEISVGDELDEDNKDYSSIIPYDRGNSITRTTTWSQEDTGEARNHNKVMVRSTIVS